MWTNCHLENAAYPSATVAGYPLGRNSASPRCKPACARPPPSTPAPPPPPPSPPAASPARTATTVLIGRGPRDPLDPLDSADSVDSADPLRERTPNARTGSARVRRGHAAPSRQCAVLARSNTIARGPAAVISGARAFGSSDPTTFSARSNERRMAERSIAVSNRGAATAALSTPATAPHPRRSITSGPNARKRLFATRRGHIENHVLTT